MIETKEDYQQLNGMLADTIDEVDHSALLETIEALREVAKAVNVMDEAVQMDEGVVFFDRVLPALDALPDWLKEDG